METTESATPSLRSLPLSALTPSEHNVRTTPGSRQALDELKASIAAHGVLENLLVRPVETGGRTRYEVVAGRRRLNAIAELADEGALHPDAPVPCAVVDPDADDTELSLAENTMRLDMHPADQVTAFRQLNENGMAPDAIATRFGVSTRTVEQRLRLAGLAPELLDAAREDRLNVQHLEAFAVTVDQERQSELWNRIKDNSYLPHADWIRNELGRDNVLAGSSRARFVGLDAYREAGGRTDRDLFTDEDDDRVILVDAAIVDRLAGEKLEETAAKLRTEGWKWAEPHLELEWDATHAYGRLRGEPAGPTAEQQAALDRIEKRIAEIEDTFEKNREEWEQETDPSDDHPAYALEAERDELEAERGHVQTLADERQRFSAGQMACAGCLVTIDHGELRTHAGLVRPEDEKDVPRPAAPADEDPEAEDGATRTPDDGETAGGTYRPPAAAGDAYRPPVSRRQKDPATEAIRSAGLTQGLAEDLGLVRNAIVKARLADDYEAAFDLAACQMAAAVFGTRTYGEQPLSMTLTETSDTPVGSPEERRTFEKASPGIASLAEHRASLPLAWLDHTDPGKRFVAFIELPLADRQRLFAAAVARTLRPQLSFEHGAHPETEATVARLDVPFAAIWRPDVRYWKRMQKGEILAIARRTLGADWAAAHAKDKKDELAAAMGGAFAREADAAALALTPEGRAAALSWAPAGFAAFDPARTGDDDDDTPAPAPKSSPKSRRRKAAAKNEAESAPDAAPAPEAASAGEEHPPLNGNAAEHPAAAAGPSPSGEAADGGSDAASLGGDENDEAEFDHTPAETVPAFLRN